MSKVQAWRAVLELLVCFSYRKLRSVYCINAEAPWPFRPEVLRGTRLRGPKGGALAVGRLAVGCLTNRLRQPFQLRSCRIEIVDVTQLAEDEELEPEC